MENSEILTSGIDQFFEERRTSTVFKRLNRKMSTFYLYLFGFNFKYLVGDQDMGFYWYPGILKDINYITWKIKFYIRWLPLDFIAIYLKIRKTRTEREEKILHFILNILYCSGHIRQYGNNESIFGIIKSQFKQILQWTGIKK